MSHYLERLVQRTRGGLDALVPRRSVVTEPKRFQQLGRHVDEIEAMPGEAQPGSEEPRAIDGSREASRDRFAAEAPDLVQARAQRWSSSQPVPGDDFPSLRETLPRETSETSSGGMLPTPRRGAMREQEPEGVDRVELRGTADASATDEAPVASHEIATTSGQLDTHRRPDSQSVLFRTESPPGSDHSPLGTNHGEVHLVPLAREPEVLLPHNLVQSQQGESSTIWTVARKASEEPSWRSEGERGEFDFSQWANGRASTNDQGANSPPHVVGMPFNGRISSLGTRSQHRETQSAASIARQSTGMLPRRARGSAASPVGDLGDFVPQSTLASHTVDEANIPSRRRAPDLSGHRLRPMESPRLDWQGDSREPDSFQRPAPSTEKTAVHVHIGRIEVRAPMRQTPSTETTPKRRGPALDLSNYLKQRQGGASG